MILVKRVRINGFRSVEDGTIDNAGHCHALVGRNSSGKSNILRALHLFFTGDVDPGKPLSFPRDLFERPTRKKRKRLSIFIEFLLPPSFKFRKQQVGLHALGRQFEVERSWELDPQRNITSRFVIRVNGQPVADSDALGVQLLSLIRFRYIPNRSVPADVLRSESQTLASSIFRRLKDQKPANELLNGLNEAASKMLEGATAALTDAGSPLSQPSVATRALSDMLSMSGFTAQGAHGGLVQDEDWGAGHQTFFLYQVLRALDTDYSRYFGWRQATIWAVEEPESALHRDLETRLASNLRSWTMDPGLRLQVFMTTHSPVFAMAADSGSWICLPKEATEIAAMPMSQLVRAAEREGVSGWTHPVLAHPWNPVVLVEGMIDAEVLNHLASLAGLERVRFLPLPELDSEETGGGKDAMISYLRRHQQIIQNRLPEAPLIALFDWDVSDQQLQHARTGYGSGGSDRVIRMDPTCADPLLGFDWKGIERFYPTAVVNAAHEANEIVVGFAPNRPYSVSASELRRGKGALRARVLDITALSDFVALAKILRIVEVAIESTTRAQRDMFADVVGP